MSVWRLEIEKREDLLFGIDRVLDRLPELLALLLRRRQPRRPRVLALVDCHLPVPVRVFGWRLAPPLRPRALEINRHLRQRLQLSLRHVYLERI